MSDSVAPSTVVVVTFDRWPWPALGCYGHEWIDTPNWDHLAAGGFLFDRCVAAVNKEDRAHEKMWKDFLPRLRLAGIQTSLFRESGASVLGNDPQWGHVQEIIGNDADDAPLAERSFARLAQAAIAEISSSADSSAPRLIWVHGIGLPEPCPILRTALELYAADFAEEGFDLSSMTDADLVDHELTRATVLSLLDHWLGELLETARALPGCQRLCVFAWEGAIWEPVPRPTPLIAPFDPQQAQVPCIVAGEDIDPGRTSALVTTRDLFPTVAGWLSLPDNDSADEMNLAPLIAGDVRTVHADVRLRHGDSGGLWTPGDLTLLACDHDGTTATQRYLWPEDGYALHDIAAQTPDETATRTARLV